MDCPLRRASSTQARHVVLHAIAAWRECSAHRWSVKVPVSLKAQHLSHRVCCHSTVMRVRDCSTSIDSSNLVRERALEDWGRGHTSVVTNLIVATWKLRYMLYIVMELLFMYVFHDIAIHDYHTRTLSWISWSCFLTTHVDYNMTNTTVLLWLFVLQRPLPDDLRVRRLGCYDWGSISAFVDMRWWTMLMVPSV